MMKSIACLVILLLFSCNKHPKEVTNVNDGVVSDDTIQTAKPISTDKEIAKEYSNQRFRKVKVEKMGDKFHIQGEAQIFEANFSWVIEDGHSELKKGHEMTDAGAPDWGNFDFTIDEPKKDDNSSLALVLFEISAKDGSRQHELIINLQ